MNSATAIAGSGTGCRPPFTASQWEELEHQALIFKYLIAGIPVPSDLVLPIRRSYETMAARFYSHPALGYCSSYYGKKLDPEPGRCRRTDGKKWRCSKDAYPDSKYCERHMHRGRNRSRKHVEAPQALPQSQSSSSTVTSIAPSSAGSSGSGSGSGSSGAAAGGGSFHALPLDAVSAGHHHSASSLGVASSSHIHPDPPSYGIGSAATKDFSKCRYLRGAKPDLDEYSFSESSLSVRGLGMDSPLDSSWRMMSTPSDSFSLFRDERESSILDNNYFHNQPVQDLEQATFKNQHSFFQSDFNSSEAPVKNVQALRPFFDEWPRTREQWLDLEEKSNRASFSTTQLSISIPMASSDFSTTSSRSQNGSN
ncbi:Growth-regulating factor 3 [Apostasia shenzhenica]|uniref:Growth-regulating factor n=1 Tax=Apostasia shenzhenica TaxID=1088818 RepID=A0A2H9ZRQ8_9ASPA|nr:Growth-regulating factor 3 [Apostasia shenzhenica]